MSLKAGLVVGRVGRGSMGAVHWGKRYERGCHPGGKGVGFTANNLSSSSPSPGLVTLGSVILPVMCSWGDEGLAGHQDYAGPFCGLPWG